MTTNQHGSITLVVRLEIAVKSPQIMCKYFKRMTDILENAIVVILQTKICEGRS